MTRARRGDLAVIVRHEVTYCLGRRVNELTTRAHLGTVTSVTCEGVARIVESPSLGTWQLARSHADDEVLILPQGIDTEALTAAYAARRWPTAPDSPMVYPFQSLDDARAFVRGYVQ